MKKLILYLSFTVLFLAQGLWAQTETVAKPSTEQKEETKTVKPEPLIHVLLSAKSFFREQSFLVDYVVNEDSQAKLEEMPFLTDATAVLEKKGFTKTGVVMRYRITPHKSGEFKIPILKGLSKGKDIISVEKVIKVQEPKTHENVYMDVEFPEGEYYVGQAIPVKFVWYSELPFYAYRALSCRAPFLNDSALAIYEPQGAPQGGDNGTIGLPISQQRVICKRAKVKRNGKELHTISFERIVTVNRAGNYTFAPIKMIASFVPSKVRPATRRWSPTYPSFFNNEFFDDDLAGVAFVKYLVSSKPKKIKILDLPKDGRPQGFSGIVGPFKMEATAEPKVLKAGDPLTLNVTMSNHPYLETIALPTLKENRAITAYFAVNTVQALPVLENDSLRYSKSLRPLSPDTKEIPSLKVSYFNPQTKKYEVSETNVIPLTVNEADVVTAFDAKLNSDEKLKNTIEKSEAGIRHNYSSLEDGKRSWTSAKTLLSLAIFVPSIFFLVFVFVTRQQRRDLADPEGAIIRKAYKKFLAQKLDDQASLEKAVRQYFAEKLSLPPNVHSFEDLKKQLDGKLNQQKLEALQKVYERSDRFRYQEHKTVEGGTQAKAVKLLIKSIDRRLKYA